jgi:tetratricopeptide (TPR) repeat protein
LRLGQLALERGDDRAAEDLLGVARRGRATRKEATGLLAALARRRGADAEADDLEKEAARLAADAPAPDLDPVGEQIAPRQIGLQYTFRGMPELLAAARDDPQRYRDIAELYLRQVEGRPAAATYAYAGLYLSRAGDYEAAMPLLRKGLRLDPDSSLAHELLAQVLLSRARAEGTGSPGSEQAKGWCLEAAEHARRATELSPGHSRAYLVWGLALTRLGEPAAALAPLRQGVLCEPGYAELHLALGLALLDAGQTPEAARRLEDARRLAPHDPRPRQALDRLRSMKD